MVFFRQIAVPVLLTVFGTVSFLGTGLHLLPGCGHFHALGHHCTAYAHSGHERPEISDEPAGTPHSDCAICRFLAIPQAVTPPPMIEAGGIHFVPLVAATTLQAARETERPYGARAPPRSASNA